MKKDIIYVATRLFDPAGRYYGALLEKACNDALKEIPKIKSDHRNLYTYLPFRDSNESVSVKEESLTKAIYRIDCDMLNNSALLVAPIYELQQDGGIAFEIGYAFGKNIPTVLVSTNFFTYTLDDKSFSVDPFFKYFAGKLVECGEIKLREEDKTSEGYVMKNQQQFHDIIEKLKKVVVEMANKDENNKEPLIQTNSDPVIHIEFGGNQFYYQKLLADTVREVLVKKNLKVTLSNRYEAKNFSDGINRDLLHLADSKIVLTCGDGEDINPEIACMQGIAASLNKRIYLFHSGKKKIKGTDSYESLGNLMVIESAEKILRSIEEIEQFSF